MLAAGTEAAAVAGTDADAPAADAAGTDPAAALRQAAGVAGCRRLGDDMYRLHRAAAEAARRAGDTAGAARAAAAATAAYRFSSTFVRIPPVDEVTGLLAAARELTGDGDPAAEAAVALAEAAVVADAFGAVQGPRTTPRRTPSRAPNRPSNSPGARAARSAALDALSGAQSWAGETFAAAAAARARIDVLASAPSSPARTHELIDALAMAAATAVGAGELPAARRWGGRLADQPQLAEVGDHATSWLLVADAFAGRADEVLTGSVRFLDAWQQADRQRSFHSARPPPPSR
ncbi:hypothetical protein ACFQ0M_01370 [Kitasatospora aburaviensis]